MKIALRFCPPTPPWGSQRTFAEEFMPRLGSELPHSLVYSSLPPVPNGSAVWVPARNALYQTGPIRRILAVLRYQATFARQLTSAGVDVLFCPFHNEGLVFPGKIRQILVVHDVVPLLFPSEYRMSRLLWATLYRLAIRHSAHIICVSEATRASLVERLGLLPGRVSVVHNGYAAPPRPPGQTRLARVLYVASAHSMHKNIPALIRAFAGSSLRATHELRIVGVPHPGNTPKIQELIAGQRLGGSVHLLMHLTPEALQEEYATAQLFVYPSLCEGFGLPLLEAMASGVPVCAARHSAIPEVAADAAVYFNPQDEADIARTLERLAADPVLQRQLVERGRANLSRFSWARSAAACAAICRQVQNTPVPGISA